MEGTEEKVLGKKGGPQSSLEILLHLSLFSGVYLDFSLLTRCWVKQFLDFNMLSCCFVNYNGHKTKHIYQSLLCILWNTDQVEA